MIERRTLTVPPADIARVMSDLDGWTPDRLRQVLEDNDELRDGAISRVRKALGIAKAEAICVHTEMLLSMGEGPLVVFFQHTDVRKYIHERLSSRGWKVSWIDGGVNAKQLKAAKEWFQAGYLDVLLVQTQAGGQGLTLTRSHRTAMAEMPWTATAVEQAVKRIHRIGQTRPCVAELLSAPGCWLDEVLSSVVTRKRAASDSLLSLLTSSV
jgi:SNF2 family DNA or RNA helicase